MFIKKKNIFLFLLMENLGAMVYSRYTGFREITGRDVLELHCTNTQLTRPAHNHHYEVMYCWHRFILRLLVSTLCLIYDQSDAY